MTSGSESGWGKCNGWRVAPCERRRERGIVAGFLPLCERQKETEDERKSGTRLYQKVGSLRPRLVGTEREREKGGLLVFKAELGPVE